MLLRIGGFSRGLIINISFDHRSILRLSSWQAACHVSFAKHTNVSIILLQVEDLARVSFKRAPLYIGVDDGRSKATVEGLEQGYCVVSSAERFLLLFTFLKKNLKKKVGFIGQFFSRICTFLKVCFHKVYQF